MFVGAAAEPGSALARTLCGAQDADTVGAGSAGDVGAGSGAIGAVRAARDVGGYSTVEEFDRAGDHPAAVQVDRRWPGPGRVAARQGVPPQRHRPVTGDDGIGCAGDLGVLREPRLDGGERGLAASKSS